jgi:phosphatidylglycerol:prolipoprotein diacylglycerol transferase
VIPYFNIDRLPSIGPLKIHVFGILVACGILYGSKLTQDRGRELGLTNEKVGSMITTILVSGFIFSHIFDVFAYQMSGETPTLGQWLNPFSGISSFGGFAGALGGLFGWCHYHKEKVMKYADSLGYGLAAGWAFGRAGCFTAHDHPGRLTEFFLAVKYPGGARHDLGLYEFIWAFCVASLFAVMKRRGNQPLGIYVAILTTAYAPVRFGLDFLRATDVHGADPRYFGLTPGHYSSIAVMVAGLFLCRWVAKHGREQNPADAAPAPEAPAKKRK